MSIEIFNYRTNSKGINLPAKTFIVQETKQYTLISPGPLNQEIVQSLKHTDKKINFISPNNFHNLYIKNMYELFPTADFFGPKRSARISGVPLRDPRQYQSEMLKQIFIRGNPGLSETCFLHEPTQTLIVTDLFFNLKEEMNFLTKLVTKMFGTYNKTAMSRLVKLTIKNKNHFRDSLKALQNLNFETAIPAHGEPISKEEFTKLILQNFR